MIGKNLELNCSSFCQLACKNCNRGLEYHQEYYHERHDEVTPEQLETQFIGQIRKARAEGRIRVKRCKVVGGEFLRAKYCREIFDILVAAVDEGIIDKLKISTNCVDDIPEWGKGHPKVTWARSPVRKKKHTPITWSPKDLGYDTEGPCSMPFRCGHSFSSKGWLPCSAAMFITRVFDMEHLYKDEIQEQFWGGELCKICVHSMPNAWNDEYFRTHKGLEHVEPTESYRVALEKFEERVGMKESARSFSKPGLVSLPVI